MVGEPGPAYIAFAGDRCIASGELKDVARAAKAELDRRQDGSILIFDGATGGPVEIDFHGSLTEVLARLPATSGALAAEKEAPRGPGRPKLGVVAREVTLLPRHWQWLAEQPGGASVTLRRLVEHARRDGEEDDRIRNRREAAYRFMAAIAGNQPHYEEAIRALFAGQPAAFESSIAEWPADLRDHVLRLAQRTFDRPPPATLVDPGRERG
jgi:hypothetical protein